MDGPAPEPSLQPLIPILPGRNDTGSRHEPSSFWDLIQVTSYSFPLSILFLLFAVVACINLIRIVFNRGLTVLGRHKIASFQFFFIMLALVWFLIRWVFFCFLRIWDTYDWLGLSLYWMPVSLQFSTFLLLIIFLASIAHKSTWEAGSKKVAWTIFATANVVVFGIAGGLLVLGWEQMRLQPLNEPRAPYWIDTARSAYVATIFSILMAVLGYYSYEVNQMMVDRPVPSLRVSRLRFTVSLGIIIFLFATRFVYSVIVIARDDLALELAPIIICAVMFAWEIVPTGVILFLFWEIRTVIPAPAVAPYMRSVVDIHDPVDPLLAPAPSPAGFGISGISSSGLVGSRIFQNPARYDSDDEGGPGPRTPTVGFLANSPRVGSLGGFSSAADDLIHAQEA